MQRRLVNEDMSVVHVETYCIFSLFLIKWVRVMLVFFILEQSLNAFSYAIMGLFKDLFIGNVATCDQVQAYHPLQYVYLGLV